MLSTLGDDAIDTTLFDSEASPFAESVQRTTWEDLVRAHYVSRIVATTYRLTAKGWLAALKLSGAAESSSYLERVSRVLAAMKAHVKGRRDSKVVDLRTLATESKEPEGFIFNIIESRASSPDRDGRRGATWFENERGRLIYVPLDFNMEPVDVVAALTIPHLERIQELEERLERVEKERAQYRCPHCDAELLGMSAKDFSEHHAIVTLARFACGMLTADGREEEPCPYGPNWPKLEEFEFVAKEQGKRWICYAMSKTARAHRVRTTTGEYGRTKEEAEENARNALAPKVKGQPESK